MADRRAAAKFRRGVSAAIICAAALLGLALSAPARPDGTHAGADSAVIVAAPAQYACPMHCDGAKRYTVPGTCPVCGMTLVLLSAERYSVDVRPATGPVRAGQPATLDFEIRDPSGNDVERLEIVHEKPLHLIMVSDDLAWFAHVHPTPIRRGRFRLRATFPAGGHYTLFNDFTPPLVGMQVVPVDLTVEGTPRTPTPPAIDDLQPKRVDGYTVTLAHTALALEAECALTFRLVRDGKPVTDLEPYLGAMGHVVVISADRAAYVHSHPRQQTASQGPSVEFDLTFSRTGVYRAWGQFQRHGKVTTVPFTFQVTVDGHSHDAPADAKARR